jgi:MFS family permease
MKEYIQSFKTYKGSYLLSMIYDFLGLSSAVGIIFGYYAVFGFLVEYVSLRNNLLFIMLMIIATTSSLGALITLISYFKYKSYKLIGEDVKFSHFIKTNLYWIPLWGLLYAGLVVLVNPDYQGYYLILGFLVYSVTGMLWKRGRKIGLNSFSFKNLASFSAIFVTFLIISVLGLSLSNLLGNLFMGMIWLCLTYLFVQSWARHYMRLVG